MRLTVRFTLLATTVVLFLTVFSPVAQLRAAEGTPGPPVGIPSATGIPTGEGCRPATAAEQLLVGKSQICTAEQKLLFGGCDENPFPYLEQRHKGDRSNSFVTPQQVSGNSARVGLDPALACRVKKLFEFAESKGCRLTISSAMRPVQRCNQGGGACARQGNSCHQYGLAVDINGPGNCLSWVTQIIGRDNTKSPFGVHVAYVENGPYRHLQCVEHLAANRSAAGGCRTPCSGGLNINPNLSAIPNPGPSSPSSGISNAIRNLLNPQQQTAQAPQTSQQMCALPDGLQVPCSSIANRGAQQPLAQSQQPQLQQAPSLGTQNTTPYAPGTCAPQFYCANSTYYYRSSTCVDQVYQKCPAGCSAATNACASTSSPSSTSFFDQIGLIAEPTTTDVGAVSDLLFELTIDGDDIATLHDETEPSDAHPQEGAPATPSSLAQQTFVSGDLRYSQAEYQPQQLSALQRTLATMKDTLLRVLAYLRPFGRPTVESEYDEWAE